MNNIQRQAAISKKYAVSKNSRNAAAVAVAQNLLEQDNLPEGCWLGQYDAALGRNLSYDEQVAELTAIIGQHEWILLVAMKDSGVLDCIEFHERLRKSITRKNRSSVPRRQPPAPSLPTVLMGP